ncbi:uncharacterized protein LOC115402978 isoform X1 [Salarias fasciatus]|uniref:uncharacterized protein LOC115402978 isoform X1 n=1 Tax=Salarias fasciatus TaxID=181472 RepID=UPI001176A35C|nr:uncharacterized protein LOC115402978 isoform X1 [Salarias fasciatus]
MEHFITTIVWIVMLSDYLQANPINMKVFSDEHTKSVQCPEDSTFYAPENVQEHCIASALECFRQELNGTVRAECDVPKGRIAQWLKVLDHLEKKRASPDGQVRPAHVGRVCRPNGRNGDLKRLLLLPGAAGGPRVRLRGLASRHLQPLSGADREARGADHGGAEHGGVATPAAPVTPAAPPHDQMIVFNAPELFSNVDLCCVSSHQHCNTGTGDPTTL